MVTLYLIPDTAPRERSLYLRAKASHDAAVNNDDEDDRARLVVN